MPAFPVLDLGEAAALEGPGQDDRRLLPAEVSGLGQGPVDRGDVVPVDDEGPGPERGHAAAVGLGVPAVLGGAALAEPVDVDDGDQVGQLVVRGLVEGLPDRALGHLAVAAQDPDPVRQFVQVLAGQRDANAVGQPLAERAGGHVDPGQDRGGMTFQPRAEPPVAGHQLLVGDDPDRLVDRVEQRRGVPLGEDQVVVARVIRVVPVIAKVPADQDGHQVGGGHAGGRMPGPGRCARSDGVHAQLLAEFGGEARGRHRSWLMGLACAPPGGSARMVGKSVQYPPGPSQHRARRAGSGRLSRRGRQPDRTCQFQRHEIPSSFRINLRDCEARANPSGPLNPP